MALGLKYYYDEAGHKLQRTSRMLQGKALQIGLRTAMGGGAAAVATKLSYPVREVMNLSHPAVSSGAQAAATTGEILLSSTGGLLSMGLGVGINAYINHMEYQHQERKLCELYRPQIASILGKGQEWVTTKDLHTVAESNPSLQNELERYKGERKVQNFAAAAGTVFAFAAVFAAVTFIPAIGVLAAGAATAGIFSAAGFGFAAVAGGIGYASLQCARKTVGGIGRKLLGLDKPSVEDKIDSLGKQHRKDLQLSPAQVLDVHIAASPQLEEAIRNQYGASLTNMLPEHRQMAVQQYDEQLGLTETAKALNEGRMNVRELTFKVHGQFSGVYPEEPWKERVKEIAQQRLEPVQQKVESLREGAADKIQEWKENRAKSKHQDDVAEAVEKDKAIPPSPIAAENNERGWRDLVASQRLLGKLADLPSRGR